MPGPSLLRTNSSCAELLNVAVVTPGRGHSLQLREEVDARLPVEVQVSQDRLLVPREGEHRQRNRDRDVDTNLSRFNLVGEFPCSRPAACEDGGAVAVRVRVHEVDGFLEGVGLHTAEHWAKDLVLVDLHSLLHLCKNAWPDEIATLVDLWKGRLPSVQKQACTLVHAGLDQSLHPFLCLRRDQRAHVGLAIVPRAHPELGSLFGDLGDPFLRGPDEDCHADGHASLPSSTT
mmetsp:Transcript_21036/g.49367  ORF Transcript_21036/g.49367 Transcript_21036/m.49367 type:complete len:232 (-) Transcript_21036:926-1621(-)